MPILIKNNVKRVLEEEISFYDYENDTRSPEPEICKKFGCGNVLTLMEKRYGDYCFNCRKEAVNLIRMKINFESSKVV